MIYVIYLAVFVAVCTGCVLAVLRYTPERWGFLDIKVGALRLRASDSDDE